MELVISKRGITQIAFIILPQDGYHCHENCYGNCPWELPMEKAERAPSIHVIQAHKSSLTSVYHKFMETEARWSNCTSLPFVPL